MDFKNKMTNDVYFSPSGYSSINNTFQEAKKKDKSITLADVKAWFDTNIQRTTQLRGYNSYVAPRANFEYEVDLFFITKPEDLEYKIGMVVIDVFSKFCSVLLLKSKTPDVVLPALQQSFITLGGTPKVIVSDAEGALDSSELNKFYEENGIRHIITRNHAGVAEKMVRTLKEMIFKRLKHEPNKTWYEIIHECLVVLNYMRKSTATGFIPNEARKKENEALVRMNLEANRNNTRNYPPVDVGSLVRLYRKRKNFEKESQALWTEKRYEVKKIEEVPDVGKLYHLEGHKQPVLRAEILI